MKLVLGSRFAILSFLCIAALAVAMGLALTALLTRAVSEWEWENTAAFVQRQVELTGLAALFDAPQGPESRARWGNEVSRLFDGLPELVRVKVWDRAATVLWSDEQHLIGRSFPENAELQTALGGRVAVEIKSLTKAEHVYEEGRYPKLAEIYVPIFSGPGREVIGVLEIYKAPARLFATIHRARLIVWAISVAGGLALYAILLPLVRRVYGRQVREATLQTHAEGLARQVAERTRELESKTAQLLQAQKMEALGLLAGGVAHDVNNLLTVVQGRAELLRRLVPADDPGRRHVDLILVTVERGATLIGHLLAFSRKQVLQPKVLDLNAVVAGMEPMLRRLLGEDITLVTVLDAALGRVRADPGQLEQVLLNLAVNARDAMPRGGRLTFTTANVELDEAMTRHRDGADSGSYLMLTVRDTGEGMSAETQARIFEPFFTTKAPGEGTGLGLATVYGIVKQHQGYIFVESAPGQGAAFTIYLPRTQEEAAEGVEGPDVHLACPDGTETVLVVEDDGGVRDLAQEILEGHGYAVLAAEDARQAVMVSERHPGLIHLLLTDVIMPQMSGSELAECLKRPRPGIKVLYMSGYTGDTLLRHGISEPRTRLLQKPFTADTLAGKVRETLDAL